MLGLLPAVLLTSGIWAQGALRTIIFFPVLVSTIGVGITFSVLMHPTRGLINVALATPAFTAPAGSLSIRRLRSIPSSSLMSGRGSPATVIYIAGLRIDQP